MSLSILLNQWLPLSLALAALAGVVVVIIAQLRTHKEQGQLLSLLQGIKSGQNEQLEATTQAEFQRVQQELEQAQGESKALRAEVARLAELVAELSESHQQLTGRVTQYESELKEVAEQDPASKFYQRAAKLVRQGATLEEVMETCELPRAEAELVFSLYSR
ncbi:MAG: protein of unknown function DUF2802 [Idiomarinaceae bacterium HL-53]|nr:MAG: protein of unknown function DUF2802 [Idiomarinaceae bacterium HL-53]CUS47165.1 Protein of unknown function (DUF2802) [Idiomarinaceae bacterium HL-53]